MLYLVRQIRSYFLVAATSVDRNARAEKIVAATIGVTTAVGSATAVATTTTAIGVAATVTTTTTTIGAAATVTTATATVGAATVATATAATTATTNYLVGISSLKFGEEAICVCE
jgi:hypothetical protein